MNLISVFIVDDHPFVREGLKKFLHTQDGIELVGEAGDGESALPEIQRLQPDVTVIDLHLPGVSGAPLIWMVREVSMPTQVIVLSSFCEDEEVIDVIDAGALSYLMKDSPPQKLVEAIFASQKGEPVLHPRIAKKLMQRVSKPEPQPQSQLKQFTAKEKEVLVFLVAGHSNKEIAKELLISETTVKTHVSNILHKLGVNHRTQAVIKAISDNLVER